MIRAWVASCSRKIMGVIRRILPASVIFAVLIGLLLPTSVQAEFTGLPSGFADQPVVGGLGAPTAIDWLPDGTLLIATQGGVLYHWTGTGGPVPVLDLNTVDDRGTDPGADGICAGGEMGFLGVAVDPAFSGGSGYIFVYYTDNEGGTCANRVARFTLGPGNSVVELQILINNIPAPGGNHNGGDLQFGLDGFLYISVGDGGSTPNSAQQLDTLNGKILRITRNGDIPGDNPFTGAGTERCNSLGRASSGTSKCQEIYAIGLRNPFRIAFDPNDTVGAQRFHINDVGGRAWEEIDVGVSRTNYGWPIREGPCAFDVTSDGCPQDPDQSLIGPVFAYRRDGRPPAFAGCQTLTGGAFVPAAANWPNLYASVYLFADLACGRLFVLRGEAPGATLEVFGNGIANADAVHLAFGPDNVLYYTTFAGGGQVRRIVSGVPTPPPQPPPPPPGETSPPPPGEAVPPPAEIAPPPSDPTAPTTKDEKDKKDKKHKKGKKGKKSKKDNKGDKDNKAGRKRR
jgi:glucose/arabinose dehydrogenase